MTDPFYDTRRRFSPDFGGTWDRSALGPYHQVRPYRWGWSQLADRQRYNDYALYGDRIARNGYAHAENNGSPAYRQWLIAQRAAGRPI